MQRIRLRIRIRSRAQQFIAFAALALWTFGVATAQVCSDLWVSPAGSGATCTSGTPCAIATALALNCNANPSATVVRLTAGAYTNCDLMIQPTLFGAPNSILLTGADHTTTRFNCAAAATAALRWDVIDSSVPLTSTPALAPALTLSGIGFATSASSVAAAITKAAAPLIGAALNITIADSWFGGGAAVSVASNSTAVRIGLTIIRTDFVSSIDRVSPLLALQSTSAPIDVLLLNSTFRNHTLLSTSGVPIVSVRTTAVGGGICDGLCTDLTSSSSSIVLSGVDVSSNRCFGVAAVAILTASRTAILISNSRFSDNENAGSSISSAGGGAISIAALYNSDISTYATSISVVVSVLQSQFHRNSAVRGGAIAIRGGAIATLTIADSAFVNNTATLGSGGAIVATGAVQLVVDGRAGTTSEFSGNTAVYGPGGAIALTDISTVTVHLRGVASRIYWIGNSAGTDGGAIAALDVTTKLIVNRTSAASDSASALSFENNVARGHGGALFCAGVTCVAAGDTSLVAGRRIEFDNNKAFGTGAALAFPYAPGGDGSASKCSFTRNSDADTLLDPSIDDSIAPPTYEGRAVAVSDCTFMANNLASTALIGSSLVVKPLNITRDALSFTGYHDVTKDTESDAPALYFGQSVRFELFVLDRYQTPITALPTIAVSVTSSCFGRARLFPSAPLSMQLIRGVGSVTVALPQSSDRLIAAADCAFTFSFGESSFHELINQTTAVLEITNQCPFLHGFRALSDDASTSGIGCSPCESKQYHLPVAGAVCQDCTFEHATCALGLVSPEIGWWMGIDVGSGVFVEYPCPPGYCVGAGLSPVNTNPNSVVYVNVRNEEVNRCEVGRLQSQENILCGECEEGRSEWDGNCIECTETNWSIVAGSLVVSFCVVAILHVLIQWAFGSFNIVLFMIQMASFILYPESSNLEVFSVITNTLVNIGGRKYCPFPLHTGFEIIIFEYFQAISGLLLLSSVFIVFTCVSVAYEKIAWQQHCYFCPCARGGWCSHSAVPTVMVDGTPVPRDGSSPVAGGHHPEAAAVAHAASHSGGPCGGSGNSIRAGCSMFCSDILRVLEHASTVQSFQRSFVAFILTSYEPFVEVTFTFLDCVTIGDEYVVYTRPDVHCTGYWKAYFVPPLVVSICTPFVLFVLLTRAVREGRLAAHKHQQRKARVEKARRASATGGSQSNLLAGHSTGVHLHLPSLATVDEHKTSAPAAATPTIHVTPVIDATPHPQAQAQAHAQPPPPAFSHSAHSSAAAGALAAAHAAAAPPSHAHAHAHDPAHDPHDIGPDYHLAVSNAESVSADANHTGGLALGLNLALGAISAVREEAQATPTLLQAKSIGLFSMAVALTTDPTGTHVATAPDLSHAASTAAAPHAAGPPTVPPTPADEHLTGDADEHHHVLELLSRHFAPRYYYWEIWSVFRRLLLLSVGTAFSVDYARARIVYGCLMLIFLVLHLRNYPFVHWYHNYMETLSLSALTMLAMITASNVWANDGYDITDVLSADSYNANAGGLHWITQLWLLLTVALLSIPLAILCLRSSVRFARGQPIHGEHSAVGHKPSSQHDGVSTPTDRHLNAAHNHNAKERRRSSVNAGNSSGSLIPPISRDVPLQRTPSRPPQPHATPSATDRQHSSPPPQIQLPSGDAPRSAAPSPAVELSAIVPIGAGAATASLETPRTGPTAGERLFQPIAVAPPSTAAVVDVLPGSPARTSSNSNPATGAAGNATAPAVGQLPPPAPLAMPAPTSATGLPPPPLHGLPPLSHQLGEPDHKQS